MTRLLGHCCYSIATVLSLSVVGLRVALGSINPFNVAMDTQEWVPFTLLSRYKVFYTAVSSINLLRSSCKVPHVVRFNQSRSFSTGMRKSR